MDIKFGIDMPRLVSKLSELHYAAQNSRLYPQAAEYKTSQESEGYTVQTLTLSYIIRTDDGKEERVKAPTQDTQSA